MHWRNRNIGWCLVLASSLAWFGCQLQSPPVQTPQPPPAPKAAPPLQIPSPLAKVTDDKAPQSVRPASLTGPVPKALDNAPLVPVADSPTTALRMIYSLASGRFAATPAYLARFRRRERVDGVERPEEVIALKYRKDPPSIHMHWLGSESHDREVVWFKGQYNDMITIAPGVNGQRTMLRPDSPQGLGKERYPVSETGIGGLIDRFGRLVAAVERGDYRIGTVKCLGPVQRPEFPAPVEVVMHLIPAGADPGLPHGGQRLWYFDTTLRFPVLVIAHAADGREMEYYCFDNILFPGHVPQDDEFSPANLGHR
jgi:hypothetical protein